MQHNRQGSWLNSLNQGPCLRTEKGEMLMSHPHRDDRQGLASAQETIAALQQALEEERAENRAWHENTRFALIVLGIFSVLCAAALIGQVTSRDAAPPSTEEGPWEYPCPPPVEP